MATPPDRKPTQADYVAAIGVATLGAPLVLLAPVCVVFALQDDGSRAGSVLGMYAVAVAVAGILLAAAGSRGRARSLEVGFIWIIAGAVAAAAFVQPAQGHMGGGPAPDIVTGAFGGALASTVFGWILQWFRASAG